MKISDRVIIKDKFRIRRDPDMSRLIGMQGTITKSERFGVQVRFPFGALRYFFRHEVKSCG